MESEPDIDTRGLSPEEKAEARVLQNALSQMNRQVQEFSHAVALLAHCHELTSAIEEPDLRSLFSSPSPPDGDMRAYFSEMRRKHEAHQAKMMEGLRKRTLYIAWMHMACEQAVLSVYHFWQAMDIAKETIRRCPTLEPRYDKEVEREVSAWLKRDFKGREAMRHAVAHWAELQKSPKETQKNMVKGRYVDEVISAENFNMIGSYLANDYIFRITHRGNSYPLEVTKATAAKMRKIVDKYFRAFVGLVRPGSWWLRSIHERPLG